MHKTASLSVLTAAILLLGMVSAADAAQMETRINPSQPTSDFQVRYQTTASIYYEDGGQLADMLRGTEWTVTESTPPGSADSVQIADQINRNLLADGSHTQVSDLNVEYSVLFKGNEPSATIDYQVLLNGKIGNYVIREAEGANPALIDMGWRAVSIQDDVYIGDMEINHPLSAIKTGDPELASIMAGSEAESLLLRINLINADEIRDSPLSIWHFLFDPTGINADAAQFGLHEDIAGIVLSSYTLGESSIREGIKKEKEFYATFTHDREYTIRTLQSPDIANVHVVGFAQLDSLDGIEIFGVLPSSPPGYGTSTGDFPVAIIYGMAGVAAVGGGAFFVYSNRQIKKESNQGQTGIDPSRLVGYQTSASSGGYQTNRGEAQLRDSSDYQQTRSVYENSSNTQPSASSSQETEVACGCVTSAEMGSECDCQMQGSCICDAGCRCATSVCKDHAQSF